MKDSLVRDLFGSRCLGVFPFDSRFNPSWKWFLLTVLNFGIVFFYGYRTLAWTLKEDPKYPPMNRYLDQLNSAIMVSGLIISVSEVMCSWRGLKGFLEELGRTERMMARAGIPEARKETTEVKSLILVSILMVFIVFMNVRNEEDGFQIWETFGPFFILGTLMMDRIRALITTLILHQRRDLHRLILQFSRGHRRPDKILFISNLHKAVCSSSQKLNSIFSFSILLTVTTHYSFVITSVYYLTPSTYKHGEILSEGFFSRLGWILIDFFELWYLVFCCTSTEKKVLQYNLN
jgi:hypothetical protein